MLATQATAVEQAQAQAVVWATQAPWAALTRPQATMDTTTVTTVTATEALVQTLAQVQLAILVNPVNVIVHCARS